MKQLSVDWPVVMFLTKFFSGQFSSKKLNFLKQIRHSALPTAFLDFDTHFLQTHLQDPFAYCLAVLATS